MIIYSFYTGYIPKNLHNFGCRYAESCHSAFSTFEQDQQKHRTIADEMKSFRTNSSSNPEPQNNTPLYPVNSKAKPYLSSFAKQHTTMSPYNMPDDHPHKYYMSGYTGFVPKARKYLGQGYPVITRSALQVSVVYNLFSKIPYPSVLPIFSHYPPAHSLPYYLPITFVGTCCRGEEVGQELECADTIVSYRADRQAALHHSSVHE